MTDGTPRILVTEHGPYRVEGPVAIHDVDGTVRTTDGVRHLCRCGGSRTKPFCDATHGLKGFDGTETAPHEPAVDDDPGAVDEILRAILPTVDGPLEVCGAIPVVAADGSPYPVRARQTLCRCGRSGTKPFCDGSHARVGFRDPLPPELANEPTLYDWLGGLPALEALTARFYADILNDPDPLLEPIFRGMDPEHPRHVAAWLAETFGGPRTYTEHHGGYEHMVAQHQNRGLSEEQRQRWVARLVATADLVGLPDDPDFRANLLGYLEWGSRIAVFNSAPGVEVIAHAPVPRWGWGNSPPYVPQPWEET